MKIKNRLPTILLVFLGILSVTLPSPPRALAQTDPADDQALAEKYTPVLYFHPAELFRPQPVDVLVDNARLRQHRSLWFDANILAEVSIPDLFNYHENSYFLDAWYGDEQTSDNKNYSFHRFYYQAVLRPEVGGPPITTYGRVIRDNDNNAIVIQYWLFYYYNDWFNKHEGDWELVQVILDGDGTPQEVLLSQHHGGTRRSWEHSQREGDTHPVSYVALGSHANYFWGDEIYPNGQNIGDSRIEIMDRTGSVDRVIPEVILIPDSVDSQADPGTLQGIEWLIFQGNWGETAPQGDFSGPHGPSTKGEQWDQPYSWGLAQPLDTDTWYANRLRVEITGSASFQGARISLKSADGTPLQNTETHKNLALLHSDPDPNSFIQADIEVLPGQPFTLTASWPDEATSQISRYVFSDISVGDSGQATLTMMAGLPPELVVAGIVDPILPAETRLENVTWDAADFVWMVNYLPAGDIIKGVLICLLAGLIPTFLYVGTIYWVDRYEKEPKRLLAVAFLWGAIPALAFSLLARLFLQLPTTWLSPGTVEALRSGVVLPLIEELLKGVVVIFVAVRYRREFDDVLDGVIYGAMVGFGFAMSRNIISFLGAFLLQGFTGLGVVAILTGVVYALNQATYTAIFGAGLGYARLAQERRVRRLIPAGAFFLAVISHILHNLLLNNASGQNLLTMIISLFGFATIIGIIIWSLRRQQQWMQSELPGLIPQSLFEIIVKPGASARAQWRALFRHGYKEWRRTRQLHQLCTEMAFKRMQSKRFPEEDSIAAEAETLLAQIQSMTEI
jgi:RsiW-degrading membrane proteinase PrsW (M82 family)